MKYKPGQLFFDNFDLRNPYVWEILKVFPISIGTAFEYQLTARYPVGLSNTFYSTSDQAFGKWKLLSRLEAALLGIDL